MRFQIFMTLNMSILVFCSVTPRGLSWRWSSVCFFEAFKYSATTKKTKYSKTVSIQIKLFEYFVSTEMNIRNSLKVVDILAGFMIISFLKTALINC